MTTRRIFIVVLMLMFAGLQFRMWVGPGSFAHVNGLQAKVDKAATANQVREQRNKVLRLEIHDLKTGDAAIEEKARSELGLIKEGETFYLLVDKEDN